MACFAANAASAMILIRTAIASVGTMNKPKTNREALDLVFTTLKTQTALADGLGVVKQLVSRWNEIPPKYLERTAELTQLPLDWVLPELDATVSALFGRPCALLLPELIRLITNDRKASWPVQRKPKKKQTKKTKKR